MQATLGYQPGLLPDINKGDAHCDDEMFDGISRRTHCLREIPLQGMIKVTAQQRMERAINSKTRQSVQLDDYHI
eukprot:12885691-Prorocentrum_lima.AAC.1